MKLNLKKYWQNKNFFFALIFFYHFGCIRCFVWGTKNLFYSASPFFLKFGNFMSMSLLSWKIRVGIVNPKKKKLVYLCARVDVFWIAVARDCNSQQYGYVWPSVYGYLKIVKSQEILGLCNQNTIDCIIDCRPIIQSSTRIRSLDSIAVMSRSIELNLMSTINDLRSYYDSLTRIKLVSILYRGILI